MLIAEVDALKTSNSFDDWKGVLANGLGMAQNAGASSEAINTLATRVGDFLARHAQAGNPQDQLLKELWAAGSQEDQEHLAKMVITMVGKSH